jgi:hypothetical protein
MCKPDEEVKITSKYHEILRELKGINYQLGILWRAADTGKTPSQYVSDEIWRKANTEDKNGGGSVP